MKSLARAVVPAVLVLAGLSGGPARAQEPETLAPAPMAARIVYRDGRPAEPAQVLVSGRVVWATAQDLASLFRAVRFWRSDVRKLTFRLADHEIALTVGSEVSVLDRTTPVHLDGPVLYREGRVYVPLSFLLDGQGKPLPWLPEPVTWDAEARELRVGGTPPSLVAVRLGGETRLDLVVTEPRDARLISTSRSRFILRIPGVAMNRDSLELPVGSENFLALTVSPAAEGVDVSFAVPSTMVGYQILRVADPHRVSVLLSDDARFVEDGKVEPFAETAAGSGLDIRTVVIDPGHGGTDDGARSAGGFREADLVLALARAVALQLESRLGIRAVLTRDSDRDVPLAARAEIANTSGADLFLSLHFDSWPSPSVTGPRAVVAPNRSDPPAIVPARLRELGFRTWGDNPEGGAGRARALAESLVREVAAATDRPARGVEEWPLPVLESAGMPAVLLEVGALSARNIDRSLSEDDLEARLAEAIVTAIDRYRREAP